MMKKSKAKRRRSSDAVEPRQDVTSTGVNTSVKHIFNLIHVALATRNVNGVSEYVTRFRITDPSRQSC